MNAVNRLFDALPALPMMPKVVQDVIQSLKDDTANYSDLAAKVAQDQVISAKVLRLANSPHFGVSRQIKTIDDAISLIGLNSLRTLVIASGVTGAFTSVAGLDLKKFWRHSLLTALVARHICRLRKQESETAYTCGLMHPIGELLIHLAFPDAAAEVEAVCHGKSVPERVAVERARIGLDHALVGAELARRWNFPEVIQQAIHYYVEPLRKDAGPLSPTIYLAAHIAFGLENDEDPQRIAETINSALALSMGIDRIEWVEPIASCRPFLAEVEQML